jgi:hypothetical protein
LAPSAVPGTVVATVNGLHAKAIVDMLLGATAWYFPDPGRVTSFYLEQAESSFWEHEVKDSDRLELDRLLKCNLEELIASVRPMSAKNCEQIVRAMLDRIGGPTFEQLLTRIVGTMVPRDGRGPPTNQTSTILQFVICFRKFRRRMMFWADFYVLLCECASYESKRTPI